MRHFRSRSPERPSGWDGKTIGKKAVLIQLLKYAWPESRLDLRWRVAVAFVCLVLAKMATVVAPFFYKAVVDWLTQSHRLAQNGEGAGFSAFELSLVPIMLIVAYGGSRIMMIGLNGLRDAFFVRAGQNAVRQLANQTFSHLHSLSLRFHLERKTGLISRVIERSITAIEMIIRLGVLNFIPTIIELSFVVGVLWYKFGFLYALIAIATVISYVGFTVFASNWRIAIRRAMHESDGEANAKTVDSLLNYETVKYFGNEDHEQKRFDVSIAAYEKAATASSQSLGVLNVGQSAVFTFGLIALMLLAAKDLASGIGTLGDFVMVNALLVQLQIPLNNLGMVYREVLQGLIDVESMFVLLDEPAEVQDVPNAPALKVSDGTIVFDNVTFAYEPDRPILKGVSFDVPAGSMVAIVGPSGAGKSTISKLLFRFYDLTGGSISIDGQDIRSVTQKSLRHAIGIVPQDTVLFNDTIGYNLAYGRISAAQEEVQEAAHMAQLDGFIASLPEGYDTLVGERGLKISGGEKQRVAIARTILKAPPILILDEATSALDSFTEKEIQSALNQVLKGRTSVVIAHRLSTIVDADKIIVLDAGQIVEEGDFKTLVANKGTFAQMWERQREAEEARAKLAQVES